MTKLKGTESPVTPIATPIATPKSGRKRDIRTMLAYSGASWMQYIEAPRPELTGALTVRCKFCDNYTSRNKSHFFQHLCEIHFFDELDEELRKHREVPFKCPVSECDFDNKNGSIFQLIKHYGVYHKFVQKYLVGQKAGYYVQYEAQEAKEKPASATPSISKIKIKGEIRNEVKTEIKEEIIAEVEPNVEKKVENCDEIKDDFKVIFDDEADLDFSDDVQRALEIVENFPMAKKPKLSLPSEYEDNA